MKNTWFLLVLTLPLMAQEGFDFTTLDKLGAAAGNHHTSVNLDGDLLKLAGSFLGGGKDTDSLKPVVDNISGIYIRSFEFDKEGRYNPADLEPLRAWLRQMKWSRIMDSRDGKEFSEVYLLPLASNRLGGVAIISAEAKEVTVVYISGNLKAKDIAKLSGNMGIPSIPEVRKAIPNLKSPDKTKKEEE